MSDEKWEQRARELLPDYDGTEQEYILLALRLGREMADARAEEIARHFDKRSKAFFSQVNDYRAAFQAAAHDARSTITKPTHEHKWMGGFKDRRLRCVIQGCDAVGAEEPKPRAQVLEEALRSMPCTCPSEFSHGLPPHDMLHMRHCPYRVARRALEYREDH